MKLVLIKVHKLKCYGLDSDGELWIKELGETEWRLHEGPFPELEE